MDSDLAALTHRASRLACAWTLFYKQLGSVFPLLGQMLEMRMNEFFLATTAIH